MRIYVPATFPLLGGWLSDGEIAPGDRDGDRGRTVYAVTPTLREWYHDADLDELEHAAQVAASIGSLDLLAKDPAAPRRRAVIAADLDDGALTPASDRERAAMWLAGSVPVTLWASALIDGADSEGVVTTAVAAVERARAGDDDAQFAIDEAEAHELGWYAVQELRALLD